MTLSIELNLLKFLMLIDIKRPLFCQNASIDAESSIFFFSVIRTSKFELFSKQVKLEKSLFSSKSKENDKFLRICCEKIN